MSDVDPAVKRVLDSMTSSAINRRQSPKIRSKRAKERKRLANRSRIMVDMPPWLITYVKSVAKEMGAPESGVISGLIAIALNSPNWKIDLFAMTSPSNSPKFLRRITINEPSPSSSKG